jgi:hypothetical protein
VRGDLSTTIAMEPENSGGKVKDCQLRNFH